MNDQKYLGERNDQGGSGRRCIRCCFVRALPHDRGADAAGRRKSKRAPYAGTRPAAHAPAASACARPGYTAASGPRRRAWDASGTGGTAACRRAGPACACATATGEDYSGSAARQASQASEENRSRTKASRAAPRRRAFAAASACPRGAGRSGSALGDGERSGTPGGNAKRNSGAGRAHEPGEGQRNPLVQSSGRGV